MADRCEAFFNGKWRVISISTALKFPQVKSKRCVECHGEVRIHRKGKKCSAHAEHREGYYSIGFDGCSLSQEFKFTGRKKMHPHALTKPVDVRIKGRVPLVTETESESSAKLAQAAATGNTTGLTRGQKEGLRVLRKSWAYERSAKNRRIALDQWGNACRACGMQFDKQYGEPLAQGYIEFHHLRPLALGPRKANPAKHLVPLCSNCHSMAHRRSSRPIPIKRIQDALKKRRL
jgi:hypothetical protein